jgi:hypothetical protein
LEQLNDFNKKCIGLLRTEKLFEDTKLTVEFLGKLTREGFFLIKQRAT